MTFLKNQEFLIRQDMPSADHAVCLKEGAPGSDVKFYPSFLFCRALPWVPSNFLAKQLAPPPAHANLCSDFLLRLKNRL